MALFERSCFAYPETDYTCRNSHLENSVAEEKTAPREIFSIGPILHQEPLTQVTQTHQENTVFFGTIVLGCADAPNNASYGAPGADCSIKTIQNIQKYGFGLPVDSPSTIIKNFGMSASDFGPGGNGLPDRSVTRRLNDALDPSGLTADRQQVASVDEFTALVGRGNPLILTTEVPNPNIGLPIGHMVAAIPVAPNYDKVIIYNPTGAGGSVTYTPAQAWQNQFPTNGSAGSGQIWYISTTDD